MNHPYLTVTELAAYLRVGRTKAYQLVRDREVPSFRVGGQIRIPRSELDAALLATVEMPAPGPERAVERGWPTRVKGTVE